MKILTIQKWLVGVGVAVVLAGAAQAQSTPDNSTVSAPNAVAVPAMADSVSQVLQLSQAKVSDSTILSFIQNSSASYPMAASQIIYLKQQGVSDTVLNAMINAHPTMTASTAPAPTDASDASVAPQTASATAPSVTTYETVPSSTVTVIPDTQTYYYDNGYYGYPYAYPYYYAPVGVSVGLGWGWGGGWRGGGWHGGYGGGWHGGGGWHR